MRIIMKNPAPARASRSGAIRTAIIALLVAAIGGAALSACSVNPPDIEFYCDKPSWTNYQGDSTTYSITFGTDAAALPWDCSAVVSFDIYDLDGYVHAAAAYVLDLEATVEETGWELPFLGLSRQTFTIDLADLEAAAPRGSASYTSRLRGIRTIVPRDVEFHPSNTLLHPAWWRLPFEPVEDQGEITGYLADSLPD